MMDAHELRRRSRLLVALQSPCGLCPRDCGAERASGAPGLCGASAGVEVASYGPHFGEEPELVGAGGSGTIFFAHCGLRCSFCQNYEISHGGQGGRTGTSELAGMMLRLEALGCVNVNLVTPTHYAPQIVAALAEAVETGLTLPVVYNCGGYESVETLSLLEGVVDVYMPDAKFADPTLADALCRAPDYPQRMLACLSEMERQVGDLTVDPDGVARRGLLIRHLVMPGHVEDSARLFRLLAEHVSASAVVNVMGQYRPCGTAAGEAGPMGAPLTRREHEKALTAARAAGLRMIR